MPSHDVECRYTLVTLVNAVAVERQTGASKVLQDQSSQLRIPRAPPRWSISLTRQTEKGLVQHGAVEPQGIHLSRRGAWAVWRNASARHRLYQLQPTATNCNELHILRSAQKPLSFTTHQNAVTARTAGENSSRFYARRGNPSVAPKIGRLWPPRHVLQLFSTP